MHADNMENEFLDSARSHFRYYKKLGDGALAQLEDAGFEWPSGELSNSIRVILKHLHGNMLSRWTDFLTSDGEKSTRNRDGEFESEGSFTRIETMAAWEEGWGCLFSAIDSLDSADIMRTVKIRGQNLSVLEALHRQMTHVAYHVGQIVWIARERTGESWESLSVPRGGSAQFNAEAKKLTHYRDWLNDTD